MGMYVNQTTILCLSPHIPGTSDEYVTEITRVSIAFNGQDFLEDTSDAFVKFHGTGKEAGIIFYLFSALLIALFMMALILSLVGFWNMREVQEQKPQTVTLRDSTF